MMKAIKKAIEAYRKEKASSVASREKENIAKLFNDRYTYRERWDKTSKERTTGTAMYGINPRIGFAWMCPECNKIHIATECSVFSGLQYPKCCSTPMGYRSGINTTLIKGVTNHE